MPTDAELLEMCRSQMSDAQLWAHQRAGELPLDEPTEADERKDVPLYTPDEMLPAWLLWVGVGLSVAFLAYVAAMAS